MIFYLFTYTIYYDKNWISKIKKLFFNFKVLDKNHDIQTAMAMPAQDLNESDLEAELADLLKEDAPHDDPPDDSGLNTSDVEDKFKHLTLNLPKVPETSPNTSQIDVEVDNLIDLSSWFYNNIMFVSRLFSHFINIRWSCFLFILLLL